MKVKHLDDLYTWKQIRKLCLVHDTNQHNGFVPVALLTPGEGCHSHYGKSGSREDHFEWYGKSTAHYAKRLWEFTRLELRSLEDESLAYDVVQASECFNTIQFKSADAAASYTKTFWRRLQELADSGRVKAVVGKQPVNECLWVKGKESQDIVIADDGDYLPHTSRRPIPESRELRSPDWASVRKYFVELSASELAFLNGDGLINRAPTAADKVLFEACDKLDVESIRAALMAGANPNSFSEREWGEVVGQRLFSALEYPVTDEQYNKVCEAITLLVDYGYDLDLSGYGEGNALWDAGHTSARCVKFLLDKGANPNAVCWLAADEGERATAFDHVSWDIAADGPEPDLLEMQKILDARGGKYFSELVPDYYGR